MKQKISLIIIGLIMALPIALYALIKEPINGAALASTRNKPTVLEFSTPLCAECQKLKKVLDIVEPQYKRKVEFIKINANVMDKDTTEQVHKYNIRVVPTTIFLDENNNVVARKEGAMTEYALKKQLDEISK